MILVRVLLTFSISHKAATTAALPAASQPSISRKLEPKLWAERGSQNVVPFFGFDVVDQSEDQSELATPPRKLNTCTP